MVAMSHSPGMHRRILALGAALSIACANDAPPQAASVSRPVRRADRRVTPVVASAVDPDTVGCEAIPKKQFDEPEALVHEWVRRDSLGLFLEPDARLFELMACPGHLGGGDAIVVASEPEIRNQGRRGDSTVFLIAYRRYGLIHSDSTGERTIFVRSPGIDSVVVPAVPTPFGWRFPHDVANPHVSPRVALQVVATEWVPASRDTLEAVANEVARR